MAQIIDLGKIRFSYQGTYNPATEYETNDVVKYGGNVYVYINATASTGNVPTNTTFWSLMVEGFKFQGSWSGATAYKVGDAVAFGGTIYLAVADNTNQQPPNLTYWSKFIEGLQYEGVYSGATQYQKSDVVRYGNNVYLALQTTTGNLPTNTTYWDLLVQGIKFEGVYNSLTTYQVNDIVSYGGSSYIALQETTGNAPTDPTFWGMVANGTFPSQTGQNGKFLSTDGTQVLWTTDISVDTLEATENLYVGANARTQWENSGAKTYTVTNKSKTNDIVTLTTSTNHTLGAFQFIDVALDPADPDFDGEYEIIDVTSNTLTYEKVGSNVASTATGGTVDAVTGYTNSVAHFYIDADDYAQVSFRNASDAANASTDFIAYASNGDDFAGYIDMGITSENFSDPEFTITGPNDGYIFMDAPVGTTGAGNLVLATGARGTENKIVFAAGGLDSDSTQMEITPDLNVHIEIPTPSTSPSTGALTVVGGVGIQGDMNIQGNVDIVGTISFGGSGTTVTTQNLAVSDPVIFAGSNNLSDVVDLGLVGEYAEDVTDEPSIVNNKALTSNVATLTTASAHGYSIGDVVVVADVDATFNGTYVITDVPTSTTFKYAKEATNVASAAVSPTGTATVTHERRWGGVVRDVSDGAKIKFFQGLTTKPTNTVDFTNAGLTFAPIKAGDAEFGTISGTSITTSGGTSTLAGTVNITSAADFTGANVTLGSGTWAGAPTFSGDITFSGSPTFTGTPSFTGGIRVQELLEDIVDTTHSSNAIPIDYSLGNVFFLTNSLSANATVNMTNVPTTDGRVFTVNILVTQGSTGYIPNVLNVNGSATTIRWAAGTTPTPTSSNGKIDIFTFTIYRRGGAFVAFGSANTNF